MNNEGNHIVQIVEEGMENTTWTPGAGAVTTRLARYFTDEGILPSGESANRVVAEACGVLAQCVSPHGEAGSRTGLVCGYVQSGKTASMTAVSALAKDNGYRVVVLIAGVTTNLLAQTRDRVQTQLREASPEWAWLMLTNPTRQANHAEIEMLLREWRSDQYREEDRRTLFVTVMKNHHRLRNLAELFASADFSDIPAIIFDDEADQASLNTRPGDREASTTYATVAALRQAFPWHTYLQYTATPQAPLLITRIDSLSADFAELVSPGEGYTGGEGFFRAPAPAVENIPEGEIFPDGDLPLEPPESLLRAIQVFIVGVAAGRRLESGPRHRSMLVHPSRRTATHQQYHNWVSQLRREWHEVLLGEEEFDRAELVEEFREAHRDLAQTCEELPEFSEIEGVIPVAINQTVVTLVNSTDGREVPWSNGYSHILVGGEKLGRGYTVRGLTVTYMPRAPGGWTADTIQQRARFFGYHQEYFGYCRVYLHPEVREIYVAYVQHEEDMRRRLSEHRGRHLREWRRLFYLDRRLEPTRRNVVLSPYLRPRLRRGWFVPRAPHDSPGRGSHNREIIRRVEELAFGPNGEHPQHQYAIARLEGVFEQILVPLSYLEEGDALGLCVVNCNLKTILERNAVANCLVYLMDRGRLRVRRLDGGGCIPQLFQGRSSAGAQSYPGDRAFAVNDMVTVQIHMLRVESEDEVRENVGAVAVRLPTEWDLLVQDEE